MEQPIKLWKDDTVLYEFSDKELASVFYYFLKKRKIEKRITKVRNRIIINDVTADFRKTLDEMIKEFEKNYEKIREEALSLLRKVRNSANIKEEAKSITDIFRFEDLVDIVPLDLRLVKIKKVVEKDTTKTYLLEDFRSMLILMKFFMKKREEIIFSTKKPFIVTVKKYNKYTN